MARVFAETESANRISLALIIDRVARWMKTETTHGCLFHAAVAASPQDEELRALLDRYKAEMTDRAADMSGLHGLESEISVIVEGLMQSWPLRGVESVRAAKALGALICLNDNPHADNAKTTDEFRIRQEKNTQGAPMPELKNGNHT